MSTPRTSVKMAALAPMPRASVIITTNVNPGDFRSCRKAKRMSFTMALSFGSQRDDWIDARCAASRHAACDQSNEHQRDYGRDHGSGIDCTDVVEQRHQHAARSKRTDQSDSDPNCYQRHALAKHELENVCALRAKRHANPEFASALGHRQRHHSVKTNARKHQREHGKRA